MSRETRFACIACRAPADEFSEFCDACHREDTICEVEPNEDENTEAFDARKKRGRARKLSSVSPKLPPKISTGRSAWDIVLGGGLTRPSSVLVKGPKGVGKSTSALRIADHVCRLHRGPALYGASEMPKEHVRRLGDRLGLSMVDLYINDSAHLEDMIEDIEELRPVLIVWDSIQRFFVRGELGEIPLRETVTGAIRAGNHVRAASILLSQVTKDDQFVGRSTIGHDVDVILELARTEGPKKARGRPRKDGEPPRQSLGEVTIACLEKNRFGMTPISAVETLDAGSVRSPAGEAAPPPRVPSEKEKTRGVDWKTLL
jgi:DNA repair protein RadA/Sms